MKVHELIEQLLKMPQNAEVEMSVAAWDPEGPLALDVYALKTTEPRVRLEIDDAPPPRSPPERGAKR